MKQYINTDQQIHWMCQVITKTNRSFVPKKKDDSHTNLYYDVLGNRITGRWIDTINGKLLLTLNLSTLQFEWLGSSYLKIKSFNTIGKKIDEIEKEIEAYLPELGLSPLGFTDKLHFDIPEYNFTNDDIQPINDYGIKLWKHYRHLANHACELFTGHLQITAETRIWPHHFDTGIYVTTENGMGLGFGLAMQDSLMDVPYFYLSGYPAKGSLTYDNLPSLTKGKWIISEGWKGAVLPLSVLIQSPFANQIETVSNFMAEVSNWIVQQ